ncbi:MAG: F420-0--gamma-glutamyl ligase [Clostridiales bacterium]|nr:F420-0--gamma-glutamyl ligase [Clostridiales bacterium]
MTRSVGTVSMGIRAPIIREGDDIAAIIIDSVLKAAKNEGFNLRNGDIIGATEAIVARAQGNYASIDHIAADIKSKFTSQETIGLVFPILSRNRFSACLRGIARGASKIVIMLSYPADEVGNHLIDLDSLDEKGVNPWTDLLTTEKFRQLFGYPKHTFTGMDYIDYYKKIAKEENCEVEIILANDCRKILDYTKTVLTCDVHSRERTKRLLKDAGAEKLYGLEEILTQPIKGSGYCEEYGLLGSNKATDESVKLFPRDCQSVVDRVQKEIFEKTGKEVEVLIYGDGAFKDPVGKIWELADPVVAPAYTSGLEGKPNEVKLKYLADNDFAHLSGKELESALAEAIKNKADDLKDDKAAQGTTPRRLFDLVGSLCDLTSGSGDKGTPIVLIQGYFDSYAD